MKISSVTFPLAVGSLALAPLVSAEQASFPTGHLGQIAQTQQQQQQQPQQQQQRQQEQQTEQRTADRRRDRFGFEIRPYVGGGLGYYWAEEDDFLDNDDFDDDRLSWNAFVGVDIARFFSLEGGYLDLGATSDDDRRQEVDGWTLAANAALPVLPWLSPYVRVGRFWWDRDQFLVGEGVNDDGQDWFYGGGIRFSPADNVAVRLEYERIEVGNADIDAAWLKFQFMF